MSLLQRRECVTCPDTVDPCPDCSDGEQCQMISPDCNNCARNVCIKLSSSSSSSTSSASSQGKSNVGAIAGGVVGGVVALLVVTLFLLWKFYYKPRKLQRDAIENEKAEKDGKFSLSRNQHRLSTETLTSLAPSAFARSSNIIPIAYIPGVTTRAVQNAYSNNSEGGLNASETDRSSIATTNYRGSTAVISSAMMTAIQARPNLVAINNKNSDETTVEVATSVQPQKVQYVRATSTKPRQTAHSITIGKGTPVGLQSQFIPEESLAESDGEESFTQDGKGIDEKKEESSSKSAPKIINLTDTMYGVKLRSNIDKTQTSIDNRISSASATSFKSALSGLDRDSQAGSSQKPRSISELQSEVTDSERKSSNPFTDGAVPNSVAGDKNLTTADHSQGNFLSETLKDLDGRISPFDDHYKV